MDLKNRWGEALYWQNIIFSLMEIAKDEEIKKILEKRWSDIDDYSYRLFKQLEKIEKREKLFEEWAEHKSGYITKKYEAEKNTLKSLKKLYLISFSLIFAIFTIWIVKMSFTWIVAAASLVAATVYAIMTIRNITRNLREFSEKIGKEINELEKQLKELERDLEELERLFKETENKLAKLEEKIIVNRKD